MKRDEIGVAGRRKGETVEKEEAKNDQDADENSPPQLLVHGFFDMLFSLPQVFEGIVERVKRPNVESRQSSSQWEDNEKDKGAYGINA